MLLWAGVVGAMTPEEEIARKVPAAMEILKAWQGEGVKEERKLHLVYWSPADREPAPAARERLTAILEDIRDFYAREMKRLGFGPRTIGLDYAEDGLLRIHFVKGRKPYASYDVASGGEIRTECLPTLRDAGLDPDRETLVIFCNMANWDEAKSRITQNSPYYAGGTHRAGTAWQVDSPILNLDFLDDKERRVSDGQYGDISIGRYNSIFIGGIAHELGHALGLPHDREREDEGAAFGISLMGSGNRHYGEEKRGEGRGAFLTLADGMRLASHPMFSGSVKGFDQEPAARIDDLKVVSKGKGFEVSGRVVADPPAYAVLGYMDPAGGGDYDATTCTAVPDGEGRFVLGANGLVPGRGQTFRVVVAMASGAMTTYVGSGSDWAIPYAVATDGAVDLSLIEARMTLNPLVSALNAGRADQAAEALAALEKSGVSPKVIEVGRGLVASLSRDGKKTPAEISGERVSLSDCQPAEAKVGWGQAAYDRLPDPGAIVSLGGELAVRSIYAHAPARHVWDLGGKWKRLEGAAGLADGKSGGSVDFRIVGDGRELWKSGKLEEGMRKPFGINVSGVKKLELITGDGGDGTFTDWAMWGDVVLVR